MNAPQSTLSVLFEGWNNYQTLMIKVLTPLSADQLALRAASNLRSIGEIVTHMIGARARWFHDLIGEGDQEFVTLATWDRQGMPVRSASELVSGLELSWRVMQDALARWTPAEWEQTYEEEGGVTRQWVIWHLIEHDLHHGGEFSLTLGMHGLAAPDL